MIVGRNEVAQMLVPGPEGVYLLGAGRTGVAETFLVLGLLYFGVMIAAACSFRIPAESWRPEGWNPSANPRAARKMISAHHVHIDEVLKTPQFYLLWIILCFNVTAGIGVLGVAKTMMSEIFGTTLPKTVDAGYAATYVLMISIFNMAGRFFFGRVFPTTLAAKPPTPSSLFWVLRFTCPSRTRRTRSASHHRASGWSISMPPPWSSLRCTVEGLRRFPPI